MGSDLRVSGASQAYSSLNTETVRNAQPQVQNTEEQLPSIDLVLQDSAINEAPAKGKIPASDVTFSTNSETDLPELESFVASNTEINNQSEDDLPPLGTVQRDNPLPQENDYKEKSSKDHSFSKLLIHSEASIGKRIIEKTTTNFISKATQKAVETELTQVIATVTAKKVATKVGSSVGEKITAGATEGALHTIATLTGKGVMPVGVKEAALASGNLVKALEESAYASAEIILKDGLKGSIKNTAHALVKTSVGAGEKAIATGMKVGTEKAVTKVLTNAGVEVTGKVASKTLQKEAAAAVAKATTEVAAKGSTKVAVKVASSVPWISVGVGVAVTAWDAKDAMEKTKDKNVRTISKVLAWGTVGLDVASTVTTATGKGRPIGWALTGLSIASSVASDYLK